ncbi:MAG: MFS transporter [Gammaproteobacteria bacterium]|nr:MFS transporter [Gammaproteobacteria bacterium]
MEEFIRHGTPAFRRANLALFAAGVATFSLLYCVQPLLPEFSRYFHVGAAASSLSLSSTSGVLALAILFAGVLSDVWGRKAVMALSILASAVLVLVSAAAPDWRSMVMLRTLLGLTLSGVPAVAMTYLSEEMHPDSIGLAMGLFIGGSAIGGMGGRLFVGVLADHFGWRFGIAAIGACGLAAGAVFTRSLPPAAHFVSHPLHFAGSLRRYAAPWRDRGLPWLIIEGFLLLGGFVTVYNYIGYRLMAPPYGLSQSAVGMIFSVYVVGTFSSTWIGHLAGRLGRRRVLWTMFMLMLAGVALTLSGSLWLIIAGIAVSTFGFFGGHSITSSWVGRRAGAVKAQAASLYLFSYYLGSSIAGTAGGFFYAAHGWRGVAAFVATLWGAGLLIAWRLYHLPPLPGSGTVPETEPAMP